MMKIKRFLVLLLITFLSLSAVGFAACNKGVSSDSESSETQTVKVVTLDQSDKTLDRYERFSLIATVKDDKGAALSDAVTWKSSDETVATVSNGVVQAKKVGSANITASIGESSATCAVTVEDSGAVPVLSVNEENVELIEGGNFTVVGAVTYKRQEQTDAEITYSVADPSVATIDAQGKITALKYGNTTITVSASWHDAETNFLKEIVAVSVKEDVAVSIKQTSAMIYTSSVEIDGQTFSNEATLNAVIILAGKTDAALASRISWKSSDESLVQVNENGKITANTNGKEGEATVTVSYRTDNNTYTSEPITVGVSYPTVDKTETVLLDVDASLKTFKAQLSGQKVFGAEDKHITRVYDHSDLSTDIIDSETWLAEHDSGSENDRTLTVIVYNEQYAYKIKVLVVTKIIVTYEDLSEMQNFGGEAKDTGNVVYWNYSGYFILNNDIAVPESAGVFSIKCISQLTSGNYIQDTYGFSGTFDGRGHTICGLKLGAGGLFGDIAQGSVIKNLSITDAYVCQENVTNAGAGVLCFSFVSATAENIYISYTSKQARSGVFGRATKNGTVKNMVVYYKKTGGYSNGAIACWNVSKIIYDNVYVIYAAGMSDADSKVIGDKATSSGIVTEIKESELAGASFKGLDENVWLIAKGGLPIFKTSVKGMTIDRDNVAISMGGEVTLEAGIVNLADQIIPYLPVTWSSTNESVATVENGVLTLIGVGTAEIKAVYGPYTAVCALEVKKAEIVPVDKTQTVLDVEYSGTGTLESQIISAAVKEELFESFAVEKIYLADDENEANIKDDTANADGFFKTYNTGSETERIKTLFVLGKDSGYKVKVLVITKVISTYAELAALQSYSTVTEGKVGDANRTYYSYDGYFVLAGNIVAAGTEAAFSAPSMGSITSGKESNDKAGFHGTFDGRGYTVSGFKYALGGIFGDLGKGAVVKNVAFDNCICDDVKYDAPETRQDGIGVLCSNARACTVSNVYCEASCNSPNGGGLFGRSIHSSTLTDVVIIYNQTGGYTSGAIAGWGVYTATTVLNNAYIIMQNKATRVFGNTDNVSIKVGSTYTVVKNDEDPTAITYTGLDEKYWNVAAGAIPVFKTAV